jgi:hypothetical protein
MSKQKIAALALLAAITLLAPVVESVMTGTVEDYSPYDIGGAFLSLLPIYWWYHVDKAEHGYRAGALMNVGLAAAAIVALPIYLVRSRGWRRGGTAIALAAAFTGALYLIEWLGESLGGAAAAAIRGA